VFMGFHSTGVANSSRTYDAAEAMDIKHVKESGYTPCSHGLGSRCWICAWAGAGRQDKLCFDLRLPLAVSSRVTLDLKSRLYNTISTARSCGLTVSSLSPLHHLSALKRTRATRSHDSENQSDGRCLAIYS
jgi:hypothetical protein